MSYRSQLVISALLTVYLVGVATAPVAARSRTPGVSADDDEDDSGDEEIDSTTVNGGGKKVPDADRETDIDELNTSPPHQHPATRGHGSKTDEDAR